MRQMIDVTNSSTVLEHWQHRQSKAGAAAQTPRINLNVAGVKRGVFEAAHYKRK
jgi:hypothetical protein